MENTDNKISERSHNSRGILGADSGEVFQKGDIANIVEAVFNCPMSAIERKDSFWRSLLRGKARDAEYGFRGEFFGFFVGNLPADAEYLAYVREIKGVV